MPGREAPPGAPSLRTMRTSDLTAVLRTRRYGTARAPSPGTALFQRWFADAKVRTISFAYVFAIYAWLETAGYHSAYPTVADRVAFAHSFAGNAAIRLFYGYPYDVVTVAGYSAWRVGGTLAIAAAIFGAFAAVRVLRTEEDAGRLELVLAGAVRRRTAYLWATAVIGAGTLILWLCEFAGLVVARLPAAGSAYMALATVSVVPVFAGVGALTSQLAPTRRAALSLAVSAAGLFWLLRVVADTWSGGRWLEWATPLGWAEELRPFSGAHPWVVVLPASGSALLFVAAARLSARRDVATGLLRVRDSAPPRLDQLSSATAHALRSERPVIAAWSLGFAAFAAILGMVATSVSAAGIPERLQKDFAKLGVGSIATPTGYLSFVFIVFVLAACIFTCQQVAAAREEESSQRLETLLSQPVGRSRWLGGRLLITALVAAMLSLLAGLVTWAGAASQGVSISLPRMLEAGANCLPASVLFLGLSALAYAAVPRAASAVSYSLVSLAFLWYAVGSVLSVPGWLKDLTPFSHVGLVPTQAFQSEAAIVMVALGLVVMALALAVFRGRDVLAA